MIAGNIERRLEGFPHLAAVVALIGGFLVAPDITAGHTQRLSPFFTTAAQILVTLLVAAALFQGLPASSISYEVRRFLGVTTFVYLGAGMVASVAALTDVLPVGGYRYVFAVTLSGGAGALVALLLAGAKNITEQRTVDVGEMARRAAAPLAKDPSCRESER
jgi:hypothetical protein